jgi:raffinose/stachyose/melibiose transport system permease protein
MISRLERLVNYVILILLAMAVLLPFVGMFLVALGPQGAAASGLQIPSTIDLSSFGRAWNEGGFSRLVLNSFIVCAVVVPCVVVFSVLSGYAFGTMQFRGRSILFYLLLVGLVVPFEAAVIPLYYTLRSVGLTNTLVGYIIPLIGLSMAFGSFWMRAYFMSSPRALVEAARLDGANSWITLWRVLLPGARPAISTLIVLIFLWTWNELFLGLILIQDPDLRPATAGLGNFIGERTTDIAGVSAAAIIVSIPVVIVYLIFQRSFVQGILSGSVKG